jgi:glucose/arabinose dehydrogenase
MPESHEPGRAASRLPPVVLAVLLAIPGCASQTGEGSTISSELQDFQVITLADGLQNPWGIAFLPEGGFLVTERPGRVRVYRDGQLAPETVRGVPRVVARGQGGLMDVALHPAYEENRLVYLTYSKPGERGATTALARGRLDGPLLR